MSNNEVREIIYKMAPDQNNAQMLISLFEKVRDIPYGSIGSRDPMDVFKANMGTCSGKHELLNMLYQEIGFETKDYIAIHAFNDLPVNFPPYLTKHFDPVNYLILIAFLKLKTKINGLL